MNDNVKIIHASVVHESFEKDSGVRGLSRGLAVLRAFRPRNKALTNSQIADIVGIPRSTVSRLTSTLLQLGMLNYQLNRAEYCLAPGVLTLGFSNIRASYARHLAHERMQRFAEANDMLVVLAVRDGVKMVCQALFRGCGALTIRMEEGSRLAIPHSAMGKVWLATLPPEEREIAFTDVQMAYPGGITRATFDSDLKQITLNGYCILLSKVEPDLLGVATILPFGVGERYALGCAAPAFRYTSASAQEDLGKKLLALRNEIVEELAMTDGKAI